MLMASSKIDTEARYFGKAVNEVLKSDFWVTQPHTVIGVFSGGFSHGETFGMPKGTYTFEFNTSAPSDMGWVARIDVAFIKPDGSLEEQLVAIGRLGCDLPPLRIVVTVAERTVDERTEEVVLASPAGGSAVAPPADVPSELVTHEVIEREVGVRPPIPIEHLALALGGLAALFILYWVGEGWRASTLPSWGY